VKLDRVLLVLGIIFLALSIYALIVSMCVGTCLMKYSCAITMEWHYRRCYSECHAPYRIDVYIIGIVVVVARALYFGYFRNYGNLHRLPLHPFLGLHLVWGVQGSHETTEPHISCELV